MVEKNSDMHNKGKEPKTTKDQSKTVIGRKTRKIKGDEMKQQKIVEKVDINKEIIDMWQQLYVTQKAKYEPKKP
ncbi:unnamed protein product [Prunus brigantina]